MRYAEQPFSDSGMAILHVDDQAVIREVVYRALQVHGFDVASVDGVGAAKRGLTRSQPLRYAPMMVALLCWGSWKWNRGISRSVVHLAGRWLLHGTRQAICAPIRV